MSSGRRRTTDRHYSAEDQALDQISKEAEERIQARRQARAEAREIRLREIERQQKEEEERQKAQQQGSDTKSVSSYSGSRRGSNDSTESDVSSKDSRDPKDQVRNIKNQLRELEDKYKAAMVTNAQLDNTKTSQVFQLELLKEQLEEQEESIIETQREYKDKCREYELLKRDFENLKLECDGIKQQIEIKDKLLKESGLVIVTTEEGEFSLTKCSNMSEVPTPELGTAIISEEAADLLKRAGEGTLGKSQNKERVNSLDTQKEVSDNVVVNDVKGVVSSDLVKGDNAHETDTDIVETNSGMNSTTLETQTAKTVEDVEIRNNENINDRKVKDSSKNDNFDVEKDENENLEQKVTGVNVENEKDIGNRELKQMVSTGSESECEVFYDSKTEMSPTEVGLKADMIEREKQGDVEVENEKNKSDLVVSEQTDKKGSNESKNLGEMRQRLSTDDSENLVVRRKTESMSEDVRRVLVSESLISMESDVTYHSESEDTDLCMEDGKEENDKGLDVFLGAAPEKTADESVGDDKLVKRDDATQHDFESAVDSLERKLSDSDVKRALEEGSSESNSNNENNGSFANAAENPTIVAPGLQKVDEASPVECRQSSKGSGSVIPSVSPENLETKLSEEKKTIFIADVGGFVPESDVCTSLTANDEVFMSIPQVEVGDDQSMIDFAKGYVTDIVLKSVDLYNKQLKEEKIMYSKQVRDDKILVRHESYTSENIDISIPKRHFSEELVDTISEVIPRKLSSGSVEILSPVVHLPSESKGDLKFVSYKVDTDADVVLTSIEEEKNPLEGMLSADPVQSPISGFGFCYSSVDGHSDLESEDDESGKSSDAGDKDIGTGISSSEMVPEFISMPVAIEEEKNDKITAPEVESIDKDVDKDAVSLGEVKNEVESVGDMKDDQEEMVKNELVDDLREKSAESVGDKEHENSNDNKTVEVEDGCGGSDKVKEEMTGKLAEVKDESHSEGATGVDIDKHESPSDEGGEDISEGGSEAGSRLSGELSPHDESVKDTETGKVGRKKSKKKGSKKNSKEECLIS